VLIEHLGKRPNVHPSAYVAPNAVLCGDVRIGENARILFGATVTAEGGYVEIGADSIVMEGALIRGTRRHPASIGDRVLVGPQTYLTGCSIADEVFLATGATVFNGARIESRSEVRIRGVVHVNSRLPRETTVPIAWVAVGDPASVLPPNEHEQIWAIQEGLNFPGTVFGLERPPSGETVMPALTRRYGAALERHKDDRLL
jgi:carbonic anhydrase/acetyltransferase-like protein (isoleucine patch superfamily)